MGKVNSDQEILEFAISREIEAYHFYRALADRVESPRIRNVFEELAEEELVHKERLELEILKIGKTVRDRQIPPGRPKDEYVISDSKLPLDIDYKDMLLLAMEKEEAAFKMFVNLIPNVQDEESREILLALAQQEVQHKIRFENEYDMLYGKN